MINIKFHQSIDPVLQSFSWTFITIFFILSFTAVVTIRDAHMLRSLYLAVTIMYLTINVIPFKVACFLSQYTRKLLKQSRKHCYSKLSRSKLASFSPLAIRFAVLGPLDPFTYFFITAQTLALTLNLILVMWPVEFRSIYFSHIKNNSTQLQWIKECQNSYSTTNKDLFVYFIYFFLHNCDSQLK